MKQLLTTFLAGCCFFLAEQLVLAVPPAGQVIGWGLNAGGAATGVSSYPNSNGVVIPIGSPYATNTVTVAGSTLNGISAISAGRGFSLALVSDGTVTGWGANLNVRTTSKETAPRNLQNSRILMLTHSTWLTNSRVAVGGEILSNIVAIASGRYFSLALKENGTITSWGQIVTPPELNDITAVAACDVCSLALKKDGTVIEWGGVGSHGGYAPSGLSNVVAIACGGESNERSMALKKDGAVVVWGTGLPHDKPVPEEVGNLVAIAAGSYHSLGLKSDGTVIGWGYDGDGQATGVPTNQKADDPHDSVGLVRIDGKTLTNVTAIAAYGEYSLALKRDGIVVGWGRKCPKVPPTLTGVVAISAGEDYCLAITTNEMVAERFRPSK